MKPQAGWMKPDETTGGVDETTWEGGQGALKAETRGLTVGKRALVAELAVALREPTADSACDHFVSFSLALAFALSALAALVLDRIDRASVLHRIDLHAL